MKGEENEEELKINRTQTPLAHFGNQE